MNSQYAGMTVNERLYVCGLLEKLDKAVKEKNVYTIVSILKNVELTDISIDPILKKLGIMRNSLND